MSLFCRNKRLEVQGFLVKVLNNLCPQLRAMMDGPRGECRINMTLVAVVAPMHRGRLDLPSAFYAVTKELSTTGLSIVMREPCTFDEVVVGFRWEGEMRYVLGKARHLNPLGGGFYQLGIELDEMLLPGNLPALESLRI